MKGAAAREISYASSVKTKGAQLLVRGIENVTGRPGLIRRAEGYDAEVAAGADFWEVMARRYGITLDLPGGGLANIPKDGPVIVIANHPFGILDGLTLGRIMSQARDGEFRILAHRVFKKTEDLDKVILPISFDADKEAVKLNLQTRKVALDYLSNGGAIGIFPGGTVSTSRKPFGPAMDPAWRTFTAKLVAKSNATVVPVFFEGSNSRRFQLASRLHYVLRMALLINEFRTQVDEPVRAIIGEALPREEIEKRKRDPFAMMDYLRDATYRLSPRPLPDLSYGFEFEDGKRKDRVPM